MTQHEAGEPAEVPLPWGTRLSTAASAALVRLDSAATSSSVATGFDDLDSLSGGLRPGDLWVNAGRSGVGKSAFARDLVRSAMRTRQACLHVARGTRADDVALCLLAAEARVPLHHLMSGTVPEDYRSRLQHAQAAFWDAPVVLSATDGLDLAVLAGRIADMSRTGAHPCELVVIDDLPATSDQTRSIRAAREVASSNAVAVAIVVQDDLVNLDLQSRRLEQVADVLLRLHREDQGVLASSRAGEADMYVTRNRRGPTAVVTLAFQGQYGRFVDL